MENKGQKIEIWSNEWKNLTPESEIQMWDYFGIRHWLSKYIPRNGKILEAGCGLGRYVFYFSKFDIDIEGLDFSAETIQHLNTWQKKYELNCRFIEGDVTNLPYKDNSLSGYISLGVIEHFIDGPQKALNEAYRVLRPGGIAFITTPNKSFYVRYKNLITMVKNMIRKIIRRKNIKNDFFQYEYTAAQLKNFLYDSGFYVSRAENCDLLYPFVEIGKFTGDNISENSFAVKFAEYFENSFLNKYGAQSITVSIKKDSKMYCFFCNKKNADLECLKIFDVPVCNDCANKNLSLNYLKGKKVKFNNKYKFKSEYEGKKLCKCEMTGCNFMSDELFDNFGFVKIINPELLKINEINIDLSCNYIQPIWRKRK